MEGNLWGLEVGKEEAHGDILCALGVAVGLVESLFFRREDQVDSLLEWVEEYCALKGITVKLTHPI